MIPIKDASSLPEEFSKPSKIQKYIIISEKQKTKQKKLPTKPRVTHLKKTKIIQAGTSQVHSYLHIICIDLHVNLVSNF